MKTINLDKIPNSPGVYIFKKSETILYIGKARNLNSRVSSYFRNKNLLNSKTLQLVKSVENIEYILVENEIEALILEAELIKKFQPKYNIELKDDKSFKYIQLEEDKISVVRERILGNKAVTYGPFPYGGTAEFILKSLRRIFPFRDCNSIKFSRYKKLGRPCLYGYTKICPSPCVDEYGEKINEENIKKIGKILSKNRKDLVKTLERKMSLYSRNQDYEKARVIRDQLYRLQEMSYKESVSDYIENPNLLSDRAEKDVRDLEIVLQEKLFHKEISLKRIEFYDISNISGKLSVGSMVVAENGLIKKEQYRRFRIKSLNYPNDALMLQEVLLRRLKHSEWKYPDLLILDGGKIQLSIASKISSLNKIPVLGLAKRFETVIFYNKKTRKFTEINLPRNSGALQLLQRLRDEAHRFAISYHRKLRLKEIQTP